MNFDSLLGSAKHISDKATYYVKLYYVFNVYYVMGHRQPLSYISSFSYPHIGTCLGGVGWGGVGLGWGLVLRWLSGVMYCLNIAKGP